MSICVRPWCILELVDQHVFNKSTEDVQFKPFEDTHLRMNNYRIKGQLINNHYHSYISMRSSKRIWEELQMSKNLYFQLIATDKKAGHTIATTQYKKVPFFTTKQSQKKRITETAMASETELSIQPLQFTMEVPELSTIEIKDGNGIQIYTVQTLKNQTHLTIDLSIFGIGVYEIWINAMIVNTFFGTSQHIQDDCYGIVQLHMETIISVLKQQDIPRFEVSLETLFESTENRLQEQQIQELITGKLERERTMITSKKQKVVSKQNTLVAV